MTASLIYASAKEGRGVQQILSGASKSQLWNISNLQVILSAHRNRSLPSLGMIVYQSAVHTNTGAHKQKHRCRYTWRNTNTNGCHMLSVTPAMQRLEDARSRLPSSDCLAFAQPVLTSFHYQQQHLRSDIIIITDLSPLSSQPGRLSWSSCKLTLRVSVSEKIYPRFRHDHRPMV